MLINNKFLKYLSFFYLNSFCHKFDLYDIFFFFYRKNQFTDIGDTTYVNQVEIVYYKISFHILLKIVIKIDFVKFKIY